jgi:N-carbamoyl-L-amino-acid hydrolase
MLDSVRINADRLWASLMEMAKIGATAKGGCNRQALTDLDRQCRDLFVEWCRQANCEVVVDALGNIFAQRAGSDAGRPPVLIGSHLDTQPTGGRFDGVYGVLAGLEVIRTLNEHAIDTSAAIEIVDWTNEEGARFPTSMMGSQVWAGVTPIDDAYVEEDPDGLTVGQELARIGYKGELPAAPKPLTAAFEVHIEQGPVLEAEEKTIGIVTGVQHMGRHSITIEGQEAHAGPTPMNLRRDPMMALARFLPRLYELAEEQAPDGRITFGVVEVKPGSINTVPGHLMMSVDIRHPSSASYASMVSAMHRIVNEQCAALSLPVEVESYWESPAVIFDEDCINAVRGAVETMGYTAREIVSGAGHDSCNVAKVAPTSMIFIPCKDGLSHNEAEDVYPADIEAGANVLLHAVLQRAG